MFSPLRLVPLLLLAVPPLVSASPPLRIHHRVFHPSLPDSSYSERAILHLSGSGPAAQSRLVPSQTYAETLPDFFSAVEGLKDALYQVALERPGDTDQAQWATSSVLACHLPSSTSEAFTIHLDQHGAPFTLDYFLSPVPHDGACPKPFGRKASASAGSSPAQLRPIANTTVALRSPTFPPLCVLVFHLRPASLPFPVPLHGVLPVFTGTASPVSPPGTPRPSTSDGRRQARRAAAGEVVHREVLDVHGDRCHCYVARPGARRRRGGPRAGIRRPKISSSFYTPGARDAIGCFCSLVAARMNWASLGGTADRAFLIKPTMHVCQGSGTPGWPLAVEEIRN